MTTLVKDLELVLTAKDGNTSCAGGGGDPNLFLFLATRKTDVSFEEGPVSWSMKEDGSLSLKTPKAYVLKDVREKLKEFYDASDVEKTEFTFDQIADVQFLKDRGLTDYAEAMQTSLDLAAFLDATPEVDKQGEEFQALATKLVSHGHSPCYFGTRMGIKISRLAEFDLDEVEPIQGELDYLNSVHAKFADAHA